MSDSVNEALPSEETAPVARPRLGIGHSLLLCVAFYAVFIPGCMLAGFALAFWSAFEGKPGEIPVSMFTLILVPQIVAWIVVIKLALNRLGMSFREGSRLVPFPTRILPAVLLASFGATILLAELTSWIPMPEAWRQAAIRQHQASNKLAMLLPFVVMAPLAEEIFFRGLLLRGYLERYSVTKAVWASALVFSIFHLNPWQAALALPLGVWYAWMVLRTGSVLPGMVSHATVNLSMNFLLGPLALTLGYTLEEMLAWRHYPPSMLLVGAVLTIAAGGVLWRQLAATSPPPPTERGLCDVTTEFGLCDKIAQNQLDGQVTGTGPTAGVTSTDQPESATDGGRRDRPD